MKQLQNQTSESRCLISSWITATAPDDYSPRWPDELPWIVPPPGAPTLGEAFYRYSFHVEKPSEISYAALYVAGQLRTDISVNGRLLKRAVHWLGNYEVDILDVLKPGKNVIALRGIDRESDLPAVACALLLRPKGQRPADDVFQLSGSGWKARAASAPAEWEQVWFDDRAWACGVAPTQGVRRRPQQPPAPRSVVFSKTFSLPELPVEATAQISALGLYHLRVNGKPATDQVFTPGWTEYDVRLEYQTLDLTRLLIPGENTIEILVGNGWWLLHHPAFLAEGRETRLTAGMHLSVRLRDGSVHELATDGSWEARPSNVLFNHLYHGEVQDCSCPATCLLGLSVERVASPSAQLVPQAAEPIRCTQRLSPVSLRRTNYGTWIADFGENLAGWVEVQRPESFAERITVRHAELLRGDGSLNTDNLRNARASARYWNVAPGPEPLAPLFTYFGFRYAEISGWPHDTAPTLCACVVHADVPEAGEFSCSEPLFNRLFEATRRTFRANFYAVPTDCPQRDERLGWMADAGNIPDVAACFYDVSSYFDKWARDMDDAMAKSGFFPNFAPSIGKSDRGAVRGTPGWSDAGVTVPWMLYTLYGNRERLAAHYPSMRRHVETMAAESQDGLFFQKGWGDWLAVEESPQEPIGSAYFFRSTDFVARAANVLGEAADAARFSGLRETIRAAYQHAYFDPETGDYSTGTQTMNAMPLAFGITPQEERPRVLARLLADLEAHEWHLTTGFLGTTFLFEVLAAEGQHEVIARMLRQRDFPSLGRILDAGSTTITEAWNAHLGDDFASHNHFNLGTPCAWLLRHLVGIRPDFSQPGGRHLLIQPAFVSGISAARGAWCGPAGRAEVVWERNREEEVHVCMVVPEGATAELRFPGSACEFLGAGRHERRMYISPNA